MQHKWTQPGDVLKMDGTPNPGYSTQEMLTYDRRRIRSNPFRIKEWDFYQIEDLDGRIVLQLTYGHASYIGQIGIMCFDISKQEWICNSSKLIPLALDRMRLPRSAEKDYETSFKGLAAMSCKGGIRKIHFDIDSSVVDVVLTPQIDDKLIINVPFEQRATQFYYNYKQNCFDVEGEASLKDKDGNVRKLTFGSSKDDASKALGILDWGRGVWPFHNEWFWSNGCGYIDGKLFGFNLGCGFGDTSQATENIIFYNNVAHKLDQVTITHESDYMRPWILKDNEGRCELTMTPEFDRITKDKILFVDNCTHQVFGRFNGFVVLDDGSRLEVKDLPAFAEHAVNNW